VIFHDFPGPGIFKKNNPGLSRKRRNRGTGINSKSYSQTSLFHYTTSTELGHVPENKPSKKYTNSHYLQNLY